MSEQQVNASPGARWGVDFLWKPVPLIVTISANTTTTHGFMPASSTYVRVPIGLVKL